MTVMSTLTARLSAATFATVITAVSAWAFVSSSASLQDPFHFGEVMAANARTHEGPMLTRNFERDCWNESLGTDRSGRATVCRRGG
jgi:hypothetical protein